MRLAIKLVKKKHYEDYRTAQGRALASEERLARPLNAMIPVDEQRGCQGRTLLS
jgi:hypothetical protein